VKRLLASLALVFALPASATDCVILLHGLARSSGSMEKLANALNSAGYRSMNVSYPSTSYSVQELADTAIASGLELCGDSRPVHFVTHSMGGILLRQYLENTELPGLGRTVMLGPPNQGSEVVDALGEMPGFEWMNGPAGLQLGTDADSLPRQLGPARFDVGVIAGNRSINPLLSQLIPGEDDGKVSVESARLEGMRDFVALPVSHPFLMKDQDAIYQVIHYLQRGHFDQPH
jgi:pimeloyl-ACP methyl ester carboxylesterase